MPSPIQPLGTPDNWLVPAEHVQFASPDHAMLEANAPMTANFRQVIYDRSSAIGKKLTSLAFNNSSGPKQA